MGTIHHSLALSLGLALPAAAQCLPSCPPAQQIQICYDAGRQDDFAAPEDPASPRIELQNFLCSGDCKPFDNAGVNRRFIHTFSNLPCGIVSATLQLRLRAECDIPDNDTIYLGLDPYADLFAWGSFIRDLAPGNVWRCAPQSQATLTLDLAALPSTTGEPASLLALLNAQHALDLYVQDDTTVDWARLTVQVCPCAGPYHVYTAGLDDDFNLAIADPPTQRQQRLTDIRTVPPFLWKESDDCTEDRGWGHTFSDLPSGIVRADLELRVKPCSTLNPPPPSPSGSNNDGISLELLAAGVPAGSPAAAFARNFNLALISGNSHWDPLQNAPQTFTFSMGALTPSNGPSCSTLLGQLADGTLDVYVQDDSAVDYARLRVYPCPPPPLFRGGEFSSLGFATVDVPTGSAPLHIATIGASGEDGASFALHGAQGFAIDLDPAQLASLPLGAGLTIELDCGPSILPPSWTILRTADGFQWLPALDNQAPTCRPVLLSRADASIPTCIAASDGWIISRGVPSSASFDTSPDGLTQISFRLAAPAACRTSGNLEVIADTLTTTLSLEAPPRRVNLRAFSPADFVALDITAAAPILSSHRVSLLGESAAIDPSPGSLTLSNIGASGADGLRIDAPGSDTFAFSFSCVSPQSPCTASLALTARVSSGAESSVADLSSSVRARSGWFEFSAASPFQGADRITVQLWRSGSLIAHAQADIHSAALAAAPPRAIECSPGSIRWSFAQPVSIIIPGTGPVTADAISLVSSVSPGPVSALELRLSGPDELTITSVPSPSSCAPCAADYNQDGGVDGNDLDEFFSQWQQAAPCADVNQDGGIDGADVELFFARWESGGC